MNVYCLWRDVRQACFYSTDKTVNSTERRGEITEITHFNTALKSMVYIVYLQLLFLRQINIRTLTSDVPTCFGFSTKINSNRISELFRKQSVAIYHLNILTDNIGILTGNEMNEFFETIFLIYDMKIIVSLWEKKSQVQPKLLRRCRDSFLVQFGQSHQCDPA